MFTNSFRQVMGRASKGKWGKRAGLLYFGVGSFVGGALGASTYRILGKDKPKVSTPTKLLMAGGTTAVSTLLGPFAILPLVREFRNDNKIKRSLDLRKAIEWDDVSGVREALKKGADANFPEGLDDDFKKYENLTKRACLKGNLEIIRITLRKNPAFFKDERKHLHSVRLRSEEQSTLEEVCSYDNPYSNPKDNNLENRTNRLEVIRIMLAYGAEATANCLMFALNQNDEEMYRLLAKHVEYQTTTKHQISTIDELQRTIESGARTNDCLADALLQRKERFENPEKLEKEKMKVFAALFNAAGSEGVSHYESHKIDSELTARQLYAIDCKNNFCGEVRGWKMYVNFRNFPVIPTENYDHQNGKGAAEKALKAAKPLKPAPSLPLNEKGSKEYGCEYFYSFYHKFSPWAEGTEMDRYFGLCEQLEETKKETKALQEVTRKDFTKDCKASYALFSEPVSYAPKNDQSCAEAAAFLNSFILKDNGRQLVTHLKVCGTSATLFGRPIDRQCIEKEGPMTLETAAEIIDAALKTPCKK